MRPLLACCSLLLALVSSALASPLREIIHPRADLPAFRCAVPPDWPSEIDAAGNLRFSNRDRTVHFSLIIVPNPRPRDALDALAKALLSDAEVKPWDSREPAEISGHRGLRYTARVKAPDGAPVRTEILLVAIGEQHVAACSMILAARVSQTDENIARLVLAGVKLIPTP